MRRKLRKAYNEVKGHIVHQAKLISNQYTKLLLAISPPPKTDEEIEEGLAQKEADLERLASAILVFDKEDAGDMKLYEVVRCKWLEGEERTLSEVSRRLGVSRSEVCRRYEKALERMRGVKP